MRTHVNVRACVPKLNVIYSKFTLRVILLGCVPGPLQSATTVTVPGATPSTLTGWLWVAPAAMSGIKVNGPCLTGTLIWHVNDGLSVVLVTVTIS